MARFLLAHDLGTSGNKATLYDNQGALVSSSTVGYKTRYFHGNWAEQNPDDWWQAVCDSTRTLLAESKVSASEIAVVALSGQMMGCTPVDTQGRPLRPSILYCDQRAEEQAHRILERIDLKSFYDITGHRCASVYVLAKLMWLQDNEPETFAKTHKTLCAKDYINYRLTGAFATDYSDASGTNAFDLTSFTWSERILDLVGLDVALFPEARKSTDILGDITTDAARATGLKEGTPVALGGGDGSCAGVGVGCVKPGSAYNYLGSSSWVALTVEKPIVDERMRTMNWAHCVPGYLHPSGSTQTACACLNWLKDTICRAERAEAEATGGDVYELINEQVASASPGSGGVIFLPYMLGERTPRWNPDARGAFIGMNLATSRAQMLRAVMEGITLNLGLIVNIFRQHVPMDRITVIGGGAKGAVWRQMMADIYDCRIEKLNYLEEATSMGAAVIGGVGAGVFEDFDVIDRFVAVEDVVEPDPENQKVYRRLLPVFDRAYEGLVEVYKDLAALQRS